jgi:hypothetical protein
MNIGGERGKQIALNLDVDFRKNPHRILFAV